MAGKIDDALRADPVRIEDFEIDAARDRSQPVAADPIDTGGMVGDEIRDRDHPVAPRHDGIVSPLQRGARAIGIVKGRNETAPGGTSGRAGAPRRGTAAGMDDVDVELPDQARQLRSVALHDQRVFRGERQGQMRGTCPRDFAF